MNSEHFARLRALTERCLDLPPAERAALLDAECAADPALRAEVEALLAADAAPDPFADLLRPALDALTGGGELAARLTGRRLGRYRVLRPLGRGGMGLVFEAEQDEPRRTVALKLLDLGLARPEARQRFLFEAEVLGRLAHPGIASILEAGTSLVDDVPLPWFAMQFVPNARDLLAHARAERLDTRARLELFLQVCDAVQHGHERGVVHRDLKPSNLLVDEAGRVSVIDFGVARVLGAADDRHATTAGQLLGTLAYMSPEQVAGDPAGVDTRSDVYSLGLVLHELLTGRPPYALDGLALAEAARVIAHTPPARLRAVSPELPEDLEWVLARALEKDRRERYASVSELAADLRRLLAHEPVLAGPPTARYRARKFVRRHRLSVGLASLALLALVAGLAGTLVAWFDARAQRAVADERLAALEEERARLTASRDFLGSMFAGVSGRREPADVRAVELLERAAERLPGRFPDEPLVQAELEHILGSAFGWLGDKPRARALLESALAARAARLPPDDPELLETLTRLALAVDGEERVAVETTLLAGLESRLGPLSREAVACLGRRGEALRDLGRLDAAEADLREALARLERRERRDGPGAEQAALAARVLGDLGRTLFDQDRADEAEAVMLELAASLLVAQGVERAPPDDLAAAARRLAEVLDRARERAAVGPDADLDLHALSNRVNDVFALMLHQGQRGRDELWEPAAELLEASLAVDVALFGERSRAAAVTRMNLATVQSFAGDARAAEEHARAALELMLALSGPDARPTAMARLALAAALRAQERYAEAEEQVRETLRVYSLRYPADAWPLAEMRINHAIALRDLERFADAEQGLLAGYAVLEAALGHEHGQVQWARDEIALLYELWGREEQRAAWVGSP